MASEASLTEIRTWKVLVAQADPDERAFLRLFMEVVGGYDVTEAQDGIGLIRELKGRPDLVIMDTAEQGKFLRALEIIRRTPAVKHLPVAVYSNEQQRLTECHRKGADGFIMKPSSPAALLGKIWKLLGSGGPQAATASDFANRYKKDVDKIDNLPTLPTVYAEVDRLCQDPDVGSDQLSSVIENDPSITLKLLNLANSAFFGFSRKINSVRDAISLLGNQTVRNTILNIAIFEATKDLKDSAGLNKNEFWLHSVGVGSVARFLGQKLELTREDTFTAGIVHDMGKIILDALYTDFYADVLKQVAAEGISILQAEEAVIGLNHCLIGKELAVSWNLPTELLEAVASHHRPGTASQDSEIASLVHVSDALSRKLGVGSGGDPLVPEIVQPALDRLQLTADLLDEWEEEIQETVDRDKSVLAILKG